MTKKRCSHCGYKFKPKEETDTICDLCKIQLREIDENRTEFKVDYIGNFKIRGTLKITSEHLIFEPEEVYFKDRKLELPIEKIKDVRFSTEKEVTALRIFLLGVVGGVLFPKNNNFLTIDYEDESGILMHSVSGGSEMKTAIEEINKKRRAKKI